MKYTVTKAVQLPVGTLVKFNEAQAKVRAAIIKAAKGKGQYECLVPVWVKAGEVIELDDPAKHLLGCMEAIDKKRAAPAAPEAPVAPSDPAAPASQEAPVADEDSANAATVETDPAAGE